MNYNSPIRIELPSIFGMKTVNAYLFTDPEPILIDCGEKTDKSWEVLTGALQEHGLSIKDLSKLIITHAHVDHCGAAAKVCEESNAKILYPMYAKGWALDLDEMREQRIKLIKDTLTHYQVPKDSLLAQTFAKILYAFRDFWDPIPEERLGFFQDQDILEMGGKVWEVIYTPGHCINQCCFYQEETQE
ncbi:MAG: MBL fold metallo-hydrolase, partial [Bacteroidota bacterium]